MATIRDAMRRQIADIVEQHLAMTETLFRAIETFLDTVDDEWDARPELTEEDDDGEET